MTGARALWPALALGAVGLFAAFAWVAGSAPAFVDVDRPLAALPASTLAGQPVRALLGHQPAVVLVWMPG